MTRPNQQLSAGDPVYATLDARAAALRDALIDRDLIDARQIESTRDLVDKALAPENGARVVARAWVDAAFKDRLLANATEAAKELGIEGIEGHQMVAVENTETMHNVIVCTQCSCTAWPLLGLPPDWYKSPPYRARVVREARALLAEMGLQVSDSVAIRVWDTSGETRYLVLPARPAGTENFSEEQLAALVTRESMIGVSLVEPRPGNPACGPSMPQIARSSL
jgi:nitrile hydratase